MAYNATKLSKIVKERDSAQNWLVYFQIKRTRNPAIRPVTKVAYYNHKICTLLIRLSCCCITWRFKAMRLVHVVLMTSFQFL